MNQFKIVALLAIIALLAITSAYTNSIDSHSAVKKNYLESIKKFQTQVTILTSTVRSLQDKSYNKKELIQQFLNCRLAYKEIEFLHAYFDREDAELFNGGAIPEIDEHSPVVREINPEGLQVIEELITGDSLYNRKKELEKVCSNLLRNTQSLYTTASYLPLTDVAIFEAVRYSIIRISTLDITGFDSPVLRNSIPEALTSLRTTKRTMMEYSSSLMKKSSSKANELETRFFEAEQYLVENNNFNLFNRLFFIKNHMIPIYKMILEVQEELGIPINNKQENSAVNYKTNNLFANNFLDPYYYYPKTEHERDDKKLIALGKILFFDPALSSNNKRACASCHNPTKAFTDGRSKSFAMDSKETVDRNAPTLVNAVYAVKYFYDFRAHSLEHQVEGVMSNSKEFSSSFSDVAIKLRKSQEYESLFSGVFPDYKDSCITGYSIKSAIASYVRSLTALNSPFDQYMRNETTAMDSSVVNGFNLFMGKAQCGTCHFAPIFNGTVPPFYDDSETEVIGVPATIDTIHPILDIDMGMYGVPASRSPANRNSFKTVTLRNIALTAPYMHNGVYTKLEEVVDFYNRGGGKGLGLDIPNQTLPPNKLNLTLQEKKDVVTFLKSLNDTSGIASLPVQLPKFKDAKLNKRVIGGEY